MTTMNAVVDLDISIHRSRKRLEKNIQSSFVVFQMNLSRLNNYSLELYIDCDEIEIKLSGSDRTMDATHT